MEKKITGRRILSLLLAAVLATSLCVPALATGTGSLSNFTRKQTYDGRFTDVKQSAYYYEGVKLCYETGILNGTSATTFSPEANITKAQLTVIAARLYNIYHGGTGEIPTYAPNPNLDAGNNAHQYLVSELGDNIAVIPFYETAPRWALGIFAQALDDEALAPINHLTSIPDQTSFPKYPDFELKGMEAGVLKLYNAGVLTGSDEYGTFNNMTYITRGAVAAIVARIVDSSQRKVLNLKEGNPPISGIVNKTFDACVQMQNILKKYPDIIDAREDDVWLMRVPVEDGAGYSELRISSNREGQYAISNFSFNYEQKVELFYAFLQDVAENPDAILAKMKERYSSANPPKSERVGNVIIEDDYSGFIIKKA